MTRVLQVMCMLFLCVAVARVAVAQETPKAVSTELPRFSFGGGFDLAVGPQVTLNDQTPTDDPITNVLPVPCPELVLRLEVPVHRNLLLGVQGVGFIWTTLLEEELGYDVHYTLDLSLVPKLRYALGSYGKHEIVASIPVGLTLDHLSAYEQPSFVNESISEPVGFHLGLGAGYQYLPVRKHFGFFAEAAVVYHRVTKTFAYEMRGGSVEDELVYQPIVLSVRAGGMVRFSL